MKHTILIIIIFWLAWQTGLSQNQYETKIPNIRKVLIEKIPGTLLIKQSQNNVFKIETDKEPSAMVEDERARGLKPVTSSYDNTGLGLALIQSGSNVTISGPNQFDATGNYTIFLPPEVEVSVDLTNPFSGQFVDIRGLKNSLEVKTLSGDIKFSNITGPTVFHSISGNIEGSFSDLNQEAPSSIISISGLIDVAMPSNTKAEVKLMSVSGKIYSGFEIEKEKPNKNKDPRARDLAQISGIGQKTSGKINGGGTSLILQSISGNIYFRNK